MNMIKQILNNIDIIKKYVNQEELKVAVKEKDNNKEFSSLLIQKLEDIRELLKDDDFMHKEISDKIDSIESYIRTLIPFLHYKKNNILIREWLETNLNELQIMISKYYC